MPAVAHPTFPPSMAAWKNFSFPLVCTSPLQLAFTSTINLQWKAEARLQDLPGDRLLISGSATQREENGTEEPQAACTGQLGLG